MNDHWEFITAARCYQIFEREIAPRCADFSFVRKGVLVKNLNRDISHVLQFMRYKGGVYGFRWGASLTYMPSEWKNRLSWHRSSRTLSFDLWEQACEDMDDPSVLPGDIETTYANLMHGEDRFARDLRRAWTILGAYIFDWLNRVTNLQGVLAASDRQAKRHWQGATHFPTPELVHAFTLARMGKLELAMDELRVLTTDHDFDPNGNLPRALKKIFVP